MREWTDQEYAQAAIDMLPGSVEEIVEFLRVHKIKGESIRAFDCPIARWVQKWTGNPKSATYPGGTWASAGDDSFFRNPPAVMEFIYEFDAHRIDL